MDFYNLSLFPTISPKELITEFDNKKIITTGCLSVWGDEIGRPGDTIYKINKIEFSTDSLRLSFDSGTILIIKNPDAIINNSKVVGITSASEINWIDKSNNLIYLRNNIGIETKSIIGSHTFKTDLNKPALLFYTW